MIADFLSACEVVCKLWLTKYSQICLERPYGRKCSGHCRQCIAKCTSKVMQKVPDWNFLHYFRPLLSI